MPPSRMPSSHGDDAAVGGGVGDHRRVERRAAPHVPHRCLDALLRRAAQLPALAAVTILPMARMHTRPVATAHAAGQQTDADLVLADLRGRPVRVADRHRSVIGERQRVVQHDLQLLGARRREHAHARHLRQQRQVVHPVVARPVVAGDAGAVEAEHHRQAVQGDVVDDSGPTHG